MPDLSRKIEELGAAFNDFKAANDQRLEKIETKGSADPLLEEKIVKINVAITDLSKEKDRLDKIEANMNREAYGFGGGEDVEKQKATKAHKEGFNSYFRKGHDAGLRDMEVQAALTTQVDEDGGFIVPAEVDKEISRVLDTISAMREVSRVQNIGSSAYKKLHNVGGTSSGWVGEEESRSGSETPKLKEIKWDAMELYAEPATTQSMLDDSMFDVEQWLAEEVGVEFSEQEGAAFIKGDGIKKPRGLLSYNAVANGSQKFGELGFIASGAAGAFAASDPSDKLIDLVHALKSGYRTNAKWMMNDLTLAEVRKFKDANGNYLWQPGLSEGAPDLLLGKRIAVDDNMPDIAANSLSIAFGDFNRGYIIVDRFGTRILRDAFTQKPYVKFYTTKRVGGGVNDSEAIKLMKFA